MKYKIPFIKPSFPSSADLIKDYEAIVASNWFTNFGPYEQEFRGKLADYIGDGVSVCTVANATLALELSIRALLMGDGPAKRVLIPSFTFASGPEQLISNGLIPVFIDIDDNLQPDIEQARRYLQTNPSRVVGILLGNTFGVGNPRISEWEDLANDYNLPLIIDSAAGFGSRYVSGERVGVKGACEIFSFHATKPFAIGEGGAIVSRDKNLVERCRQLSNFGFNQAKEICGIGTNAKLQELNCAIGLRQLASFDIRLAHRQKILSLHKQLLRPRGYIFQANDEKSTVPFVSVVSVAGGADKLVQSLNEAGVEARSYYSPLHKHEELRSRSEIAEGLEKTDEIASRIVALPVHDNMPASDVKYMADILINA